MMGDTAKTSLSPIPAFSPLDTTCVNTIRTLSMDAVQKANSGHPGAPMALAPVAYALWQRYLRFDPNAPTWMNRDRFVLSNGHASMLLYSMLHLTGVKNIDHKTQAVLDEPSVPMEQLQQFRQLHSRTPGHPEHDITGGVETTTGPLGQGIANAVGMAMAQRWKAARYGKPGFEDLFEHRVYAICGDGCLMEGIASEAASLAGHQKLSNLCLLYDDNTITIDGHTDITFTENVADRFRAYNWNVLTVHDANDMAGLCQALESAQATTDKPTLIVVKSVIAWGSPHKANTHGAHGSPLGDEEIKLTKRFYGWPEDAKFLVPDGVYEHFRQGMVKRGTEQHAAWNAKFNEYKSMFPDLALQIEQMHAGELPAGWDADIPTYPADAKGMATRESSGKVLNAIARNYPWVVGGSADLNPSTNTKLVFEGAGTMQADSPGGRNIHFGVREHAMGGIMNGMALEKLKAYGSGFLIFSDYGRGSIRLAALMNVPVLYIFTHDSIGVGEDGPTHQPIEQIASLRAMPNLVVIRPADANEVAEAYRYAMTENHHPVVLSLTRQPVPTFDREKFAPAAGLQKGGYILSDASGGKPDVILIGTGSEVSLCVAASEELAAEGVKVRVVSLPSWELFEQQPQSYRDSVLPPDVTARVSVEMGITFGWERYAGSTGAIIGMTTFGTSAPFKDVKTEFGFTKEAVVAAARKQLKR